MANNKVYIGKSNRKSRVQDHFRIADGGKKKYKNVYSLIHAAIQKHGKDKFAASIVEEFDNAEDCLIAESFWIEFFRSDVNRFGNEFGYNLTAGGDGTFGRKHSKKSKAKTSQSVKKYWDSLSSKERKKRIKSLVPIVKPNNGLDTQCKIMWPKDDELLKLVEQHGFKPLAKILGVSDMAIRGRLHRRDLLKKKFPQRGIRYS